MRLDELEQYEYLTGETLPPMTYVLRPDLAAFREHHPHCGRFHPRVHGSVDRVQARRFFSFDNTTPKYSSIILLQYSVVFRHALSSQTLEIGEFVARTC